MPAPVELTRLREEGVVKEASRHYVVDDLAELGEVVGPRYEIIDGDLYMSPVPTPRHQRVVQRIYRLLYDRVESRGLGTVYVSPIGVELAPDRLLSPDVVLLGAEVSVPEDATTITAIPELLVEVLSPGTAWYDQTVKRALYERAGIPEYWIVDADERRVHQLRLGESGYEETVATGAGTRLHSDLLGDAAISVDAIFSERP